MARRKRKGETFTYSYFLISSVLNNGLKGFKNLGNKPRNLSSHDEN